MMYYVIEMNLEREFNALRNESAQDRPARRTRADRPNVLANMRLAVARLVITVGEKLEGNRRAGVTSER